MRGSGGYRLFHSSLPPPFAETKIAQNKQVVAIPHYVSKNHHRLTRKLLGGVRPESYQPPFDQEVARRRPTGKLPGSIWMEITA